MDKNKNAGVERVYFLYGLTMLALLVSFICDREKTFRGIRVGFSKLVKVMPPLFFMVCLISVALFFVNDELVAHVLGESQRGKVLGMFLASLLGSITLMPGFIAFPLCGVLLSKGVPYMVLSAFTTTLMMVGVLTVPLEKKYFGMKVTIIRNSASFFIALIVALMTGLFFGEI